MKIDNIKGPDGAGSLSPLFSPKTSRDPGKLGDRELQLLLKLLDMILKVLDGGQGQGGPGGPPMQPRAGLPPSPSAGQQRPPVAPPQQQVQQPTGPDLSPQQIAKTYGKEIEAASRETGIPQDILAGMIWQESKGRPNTPGGGLMQIGPNEFAANGGGDINNPGDNIMAGARYLASLTAERGGDIRKGLRAYNAGPLAPPQGGPTGDDTYIPKVLDAAERSGL